MINRFIHFLKSAWRWILRWRLIQIKPFYSFSVLRYTDDDQDRALFLVTKDESEAEHMLYVDVFFTSWRISWAKE